MDKLELLRRATSSFRNELTKAAWTDWTLVPWLIRCRHLFRDIDSGIIVPPAVGLFRWPFHMDHPRYDSRSALYHAGAEFQAALEDWRSQAWARVPYESDASSRDAADRSAT